MASAHAPRCDSPPLTLRSSAERRSRARARERVLTWRATRTRVSQSCVRILSVSPFRRVTCYIRCSAWIVLVFRVSRKFSSTLPSPPVCTKEWNFSAEVLLYSGIIRHFFFGLVLSHLPLFLSLFSTFTSARTRALIS